MERTEAPAQWRKPPATATPHSYRHRAHLRLYPGRSSCARAGKRTQLDSAFTDAQVGGRGSLVSGSWSLGSPDRRKLDAAPAFGYRRRGAAKRLHRDHGRELPDGAIESGSGAARPPAGHAHLVAHPPLALRVVCVAARPARSGGWSCAARSSAHGGTAGNRRSCADCGGGPACCRSPGNAYFCTIAGSAQ